MEKLKDFIAAMIITYGAGAGVPGGQSIHEKTRTNSF